jgi:hypothetical protein
MINLIGKLMALAYVGLTVMLLGLAAVIYFDAVDLGWKQPRRFWSEADLKPGAGTLIPSQLDKREAGMRQLVRFRHDQAARLDQAHNSEAEVDMFLGENHLRGEAELARLHGDPKAVEEAMGKEKIDVFDSQFDDKDHLVLEPATSRDLGYPILNKKLGHLSMSYEGYMYNLEKVNQAIRKTQDDLVAILVEEKAITDRLIGDMDKAGRQIRDKSGSVVNPGWYYLLEVEVMAQRELEKEIDHVQPLWVKEVIDAHQLVSRRQILLRRLHELGDRGYLSQSDFLKKLEEK